MGVSFSPKAIVHCYLEFKLRYLKNMKLFSIVVKELLEANRFLSNATVILRYKPQNLDGECAFN